MRSDDKAITGGGVPLTEPAVEKIVRDSHMRLVSAVCGLRKHIGPIITEMVEWMDAHQNNDTDFSIIFPIVGSSREAMQKESLISLILETLQNGGFTASIDEHWVGARTTIFHVSVFERGQTDCPPIVLRCPFQNWHAVSDE